MLSAVRKRRHEKELEFRALEQEFRATRDQQVDLMVAVLRDIGGRMRTKLGEMGRLVDADNKLAALLAESDAAQAAGTVKVEDPLMTQSEIVEQRKRWPDAHDIGKLKAKANMVTLLGGFARFDKRSSDQEAAAIKFLSLYERKQLRTDRAIDYTQPQVSTSHRGEADRVILSTEEARAELDAVRDMLGTENYDVLVRVIVQCHSASAIAGVEASNRQVGYTADRIRALLDRCAVHWKLTGLPVEEKRKLLGWDDGSPMSFTGAVVNPKKLVVSR